jgi:hypothetical protein
MLFFAAQSLTDASVVGTSLQSHLHEQDWSGIARRQRCRAPRRVAHHARALRPGVRSRGGAEREVDDHPDGAAVHWCACRDLRAGERPFVARAVFSLHFYAFLMLALRSLLFAEGASTWRGGSAHRDEPLFALLLGESAIYLHLATGVAYEARGWTHGANAVV